MDKMVIDAYTDMMEMQSYYSGDEEVMCGGSTSTGFNYASHPYGHDEFMSNHYHDYEADNEYMTGRVPPLQQTLSQQPQLQPHAHAYGHGVRMYQPQALVAPYPVYHEQSAQPLSAVMHAPTDSCDSPPSACTILNRTRSMSTSTTSDDTEPEQPSIDCKNSDAIEKVEVRRTTTTSIGLTMAPLPLSIAKRTNLIIWDFDDTIFPTSAFRCHHERKDKLFMQKLTVLVAYVGHIFETMIGLYGASNIVIVTNASASWIFKCLNVDLIQDTFMPLQRLLEEHAIQTISASTADITSRYPKNHLKWKEVAFARLFANHFNLDGINANDDDAGDDGDRHTLHCITSIGDSICEYDASHSASKCIENRILHRVRLKGNPTIDDMLVQLKEIASMVHLFGNNVDDMDVNLCSLVAQTLSTSVSGS